jgi:hypothetical protein
MAFIGYEECGLLTLLYRRRTSILGDVTSILGKDETSLSESLTSFDSYANIMTSILSMWAHSLSPTM